MRIKNIQLKSIEARRYMDLDERPKQIRIDHNSSILHISSTKDKEAKIDFQYTANFGSLGIIKFEGVLIYEGDDAKKMVDDWNKTRKMPDQAASQIHTAIMHASVPEAVGIAKNLGLPPPIPLPQVRLGSKPSVGQSGPEVT